MSAVLETTLSPMHPFPGLRPFDFADRDFFFGRDEQKYSLYRLLDRNRFVAVVGSSGSGKSSLVRAALLPLLVQEAQEEGGTHWRPLTMQPGDHPLQTLAEKMATLAPADETLDSDILLNHIRTELDASSFGLLHALHEIPGVADARVLLVIDQFEEIFRFADTDFERERTPEMSARDEEATKFVQLLLEATRSHTSPISVLITMRSDFIGDCAQFQRLPEAVSTAQFLVPSLTRDQMEQVIRKPLEPANGTIETALVEQLLNDAAHETDQLPVLQHCLQRLWSIGAPDLRVEHYESPRIGGLQNCLSRHADEVMSQLGGKELAVEQTFRALSKVDKEGRATRRALHFDQLLAETGVPRADLVAVVDRFREEDCSFLVPSKTQVPVLTGETRIDVVHEALLRRWQRISSKGEPLGWLWAEDQDARDFRVLATLAEAAGPAGHVTLPLEQVETMWQKWRSRPRTSAWAQRYGGNLARVEKMFSDSLLLAQQEEQRKKDEQARREQAALAATQMAAAKRLTRRTTILAGAMSVIALIAVFGLVSALVQSRAARAASAAATEAERQRALAQTHFSEYQRQVAENHMRAAEQSAAKVTAALKKTQAAQAATQRALQRVQALQIIAQREAARADLESARANGARNAIARTMQSENLSDINNTLFANIDSYDLRTSGLIAVDAYLIGERYGPPHSAVSSLLDDALMKDALGRVAMPAWNLGASAGRDEAFVVLAGGVQPSYGVPARGTLTAVHEATYAILSRVPGVTATFVCGLERPAAAAVATGSTIDVYAVQGGLHKVKSYNAQVRAMACASGPSSIVFVDGSGALRTMDALTGATRRVGAASGAVRGLTVSQDGRYAALVSDDGVVSVHDLRTGTQYARQSVLTNVAKDCTAASDCSRDVAFDPQTAHVAYYDSGNVYVNDLRLHPLQVYACAPALCFRPTVTFTGSSGGVPIVLADGVLVADASSSSYAYEQRYGTRSITESAIVANHRSMFASTFPDAQSSRPNPYGAGLAGHSFIGLRYPMLGTLGAPQWEQSYALSGHQVVVATTSGFSTTDMNDLRAHFERTTDLSYHVRLHDAADGAHAVAFDYVTGGVQVLDTRGSTPVVLHSFHIHPVPVTEGSHHYYAYTVETAYDPSSDVVTVFQHSTDTTPMQHYAVVRRYRGDGTLISNLTGAELAKRNRFDLRSISGWSLSPRGHYLTARTTGKLPDYLMRADGSPVGTAYAIRGVAENERFAFVKSSPHDSTLSLMALPSWSAQGLTPVALQIGSSAASVQGWYFAMSPNADTVAYWSYSDKDKSYSLRLYDVRARLLYTTALPTPPYMKSPAALSFSADGNYLLATYHDTNDERRIAFYSVDPKAWSRTVCLMAGRPLKPSEFKTIAPGLPYVDGCAAYAGEMYR